MSGGFPHSEISGSKPIPGSPKLNAGYHVLHRLLLPRHPPNALFALDLIQKEQDQLRFVLLDQMHVLSHRAAAGSRAAPVSVLDLENNIILGVEPQIHPHSDASMILMFLSKRCQFPSNWTIKPTRWA